MNPYDWFRLERLYLCADNVARGDSQPLWTLLVNHRHAQASNPIDKIYALCGLATDVQSGELTVSIDYAKDYRFALIETTRAILQREQSIDIITCAGLALDADQPSWVPDMRHAQTNNAWIGILVDGQPAFCASQSSRAEDQPDHDLLRLRLKGYILDVIEEVGTQARPVDSEPTGSSSRKSGIMDNLAMLWNWIRVTCEASPDAPYVGGHGTRLDAYWQTLIGGLRGRDYEAIKADFKVWYDSHPPARALAGLPVAYNKWPGKMLWLGAGALNAVGKTAKIDGAATVKVVADLATAAVGISDVLRGQSSDVVPSLKELLLASLPLVALANRNGQRYWSGLRKRGQRRYRSRHFSGTALAVMSAERCFGQKTTGLDWQVVQSRRVIWLASSRVRRCP